MTNSELLKNGDLNNDGTLDEKEITLLEIRWKHRRQMAYIALYAIIAVMVFILAPSLPIEKITALSDIIIWFFITCASVIGAYVGFSSLASKKG